MTTRRQLLFGDFTGRRADLADPAGAARRVEFGEACLAVQGVVCRSCGEACESGAIGFAPAPGGIARPFLQDDRCTACGDCLPLCPTAAIALIAAPPGSTRPAEELPA